MVPRLMVLPPLALAGCWKDDALQRQVWEMQEHEEDCLTARDALIRQDLHTVRRAGQGLALPDPVPGLPEAATVHLEAVRIRGRMLSGAESLQAAASTLLDTTARCAACHQSLGIKPPPAVGTALDDLWTALLFEDEARWSAGLGRLAQTPNSAAVSGARSWDQRRAAMETWLLDGAR